ncbi:MAG TPA: hypothetical protein VHE37_05830, partial [Nevskiaceae bacterium]|nr:hypothetical protein [Nevskiaceae bacterium]
QEHYSDNGNYPAGFFASIAAGTCNTYMGCGNYTNWVPAGAQVASYNSSPSYSWALYKDDSSYYQNYYATQIQANTPLGDVSPWDLGYQNLMLASSVSSSQLPNTANGSNLDPNAAEYMLLSQGSDSNFGRGEVGLHAGALSSKSYLIELLTGQDLDTSRTHTGATNHVGMLTDDELRVLKGVIDIGFPYMSRCDGQSYEAQQSPATVPSGLVRSGPYQGHPWGDPQVRQLPAGTF